MLSSNLIETIAVEGFCVYDPLKIGGTYDRILRLDPTTVAPDGSQPGADGLDVIGDVKTGGIDFAIGKIGIQLGTYAISLDYDHRDGSRRPLGEHNLLPGRVARPVSTKWGVIIHLPAGTGTASLHWVDLARAQEALTLAADVRLFRSEARNLSSKFATVSVTPPPPVTVTEALHAAATYDALKGVYLANSATWTPGLTALADQIARERGWK